MKKKIFIIVLVFLLLIPQIGFARIVPDCGKDAEGRPNPCGLCHFFLLIKNIFDFIAKTLAPAVAGFLFLVSGVLILVSGGSQTRIGQAKGIFTKVVIGLIFIYTSWLLVGALINVIGKDIPGWQREAWNTFRCSP